MQQNGYTDEARDADSDQIADVLADWDAGRHTRALPSRAWLTSRRFDSQERVLLGRAFEH